jgi:hypothetical protein
MLPIKVIGASKLRLSMTHPNVGTILKSENKVTGWKKV